MASGNFQTVPNTTFRQSVFEESAEQKHRLGTIRTFDDGRMFVYCKNGAGTLAPAKLVMSVAADAAIQTEVIAANSAAGEDHVHITVGATTIMAVANAFADGYFWTDDAAAGGDVYKIRGHAAIPSGGTGILYLKDKLRVGVTTSNTWSAIKHPCSGVLLADATPSGSYVGVPLIDVTANYYFWAQVKGPCPILTSGVIVLGQAVISAAGGAVAAVAEDTSVHPNLGQVLSVGATTLYSLINLSIPGY